MISLKELQNYIKIEEELYDVLYYVMALANVYEINLEDCFHLKEAINQEKYPKR